MAVLRRGGHTMRMLHADVQTLVHLLTSLGLSLGAAAYYLLIRRRALERRQQALDEEAVLRSMVRHFASD